MIFKRKIAYHLDLHLIIMKKAESVTSALMTDSEC